jgi:hypothetical protein
MRRIASLALPLSLLLAAAPAAAERCAVDDVPAATLLLPYFEVDLSRPDGLTTLFSINNAADEAVLAHVVLWTDLGVPSLDFFLYLTGFDVQTVNLRDIFLNGFLPRSASDGQDPTDTISPQGDLSQDINFATCTGHLPYPHLPPTFRDHLRASHTGQFSAILNGCSGQALGDNRARGYVTVDTVNRCSLLTPQDPGYFASDGPATAQNVLWGDFYYVDRPNALAQGENLVRIEAYPGTFSNNDATFYGRYVNNSGQDAREPLPASWAARYLNGGAFHGGASLIVWRDSGQKGMPFACGGRPSWFPLSLREYVAFDEEENPELLEPLPILPPPVYYNHIPAEANRMALGTETVPTPFAYGWIYVNLDIAGPTNFAPSQGWVGSVLDAEGIFSAGFNGTPLDRACVAGDQDSPQEFP